jgi:hypothetical protein
MGIDILSRDVTEFQATLRNIPEERISEYFFFQVQGDFGIYPERLNYKRIITRRLQMKIK